MYELCRNHHLYSKMQCNRKREETTILICEPKKRGWLILYRESGLPGIGWLFHASITC